MIKEQCHREGYNLSLPLHPVQFTECGRISLSLDPSNVVGWDWLAHGVNCDYVSYIIFEYYLYFHHRYQRSPLITIR